MNGFELAGRQRQFFSSLFPLRRTPFADLVSLPPSFKSESRPSTRKLPPPLSPTTFLTLPSFRQVPSSPTPTMETDPRVSTTTQVRFRLVPSDSSSHVSRRADRIGRFFCAGQRMDAAARQALMFKLAGRDLPDAAPQPTIHPSRMPMVPQT